MKQINKGAFEFVGYRIPKFILDEGTPAFNNLEILINPNGTYNENTGIFQLNFEFKAIGNDEGRESADIIHAYFMSEFRFAERPLLSDLPNYFYQNGIAIVFPYLRAFISTLTNQAGIKTLLLPTMNLTGLELTLREKTTVINLVSINR